MFKKLLSFLFEEDNEVIVDDDLEKVDFSRVQEEDLSSIVSTPRPVEKRVDQLRPQPSQRTVSVEEEPVRTQTIDIKIEPEKKETQRPARSEARREVKKEYEFSPVISPMFGSSEAKKPKRPAPVTETPMSKKRNVLGTVISPMYGQSELDHFEMEAKLEKEEKEKQQEVAPVVEELEAGLSLDDLIVNDHEADADDCIQFSLFGDETPVSSIDTDIEKDSQEN